MRDKSIYEIDESNIKIEQNVSALTSIQSSM
jgi:hypothetical protein